MSFVSYCEIDLPEHEKVNCGEEPKGGISAFAVIDNDHTITDFTSASQWNSNISSGKVKIISGIKGELPDPSPVEGDSMSACGPETELDSFDRTFTWMSKHVNASNIDLVDALNKKEAFLAMYVCGSEVLRVVDNVEATFVAFTNTPNHSKQKVSIKGTAKWTSRAEPSWVDASALTSIFE
jgi:hypothetical protein